MKKTSTIVAGSSRDRVRSTGSTGSSSSITTPNSGSKSLGTNKVPGLDGKIDWIIKTVKDIKDETLCLKEIKSVIKEIVREKLGSVKQELEEFKKMIQEGKCGPTEGVKISYSEAVKDKKKENVIMIKPNIQQESETTKKLIREKVDIKTMALGITKLKKGSNGTVIMGCETEEEMKVLKTTVQDKLGKDFQVIESLQRKPKLKIININDEEMKMDDDNLIAAIKRQNRIDTGKDACQIRIIKRINREGREDKRRDRRGKNEGSIIIEVDEKTHKMLLKKEKLNIGWKKCPVYNHVNIKRCFKCWGFYHIAKNCKRDETCHKCAGKHNSTDCTATKNRCVNCMFKIQTYNVKINDEHDALSMECPTFKKAITEEEVRIGWKDAK